VTQYEIIKNPSKSGSGRVAVTSMCLSPCAACEFETSGKFPDFTGELPEFASNLPEIGSKLPEIGSKLPEIAPKLPEIGSKLPEIRTWGSGQSRPISTAQRMAPAVTVAVAVPNLRWFFGFLGCFF
jgi:hypothetical protein